MYRLRWGSYTWIPALVGTAVIGFIALFLSTRVMGEAWYGTYYVPMLGYFVMVSVCQAHYFKNAAAPVADARADPSTAPGHADPALSAPGQRSGPGRPRRR